MATASITGVFTILDRASGPMRKMEAQAAKTMAAIEGVGHALDANGSTDFARTNERLTRGFRDVERSSGLASKAMGVFGSETRKTNKEAGLFVTGMQKIRDVAGGLMGILGGLKFGVLAAGIGVAVQAVGALAGGVVALLPRLTDLVGVLAAAPTAVGAFAQSMGTLMLALKPAMAAISAGFKQASKATDPFQAAMEKLSPQAQTFVKQVIAMRPAFQRLQNAAGIKLFPELSSSLKDISRLFPTIQRNLTQTGGAVGQSISGIASDLSSTARIGDINTIMQSQTRIAGMAGNSIRNLVSVLVDFMVAAAPFSEWLFKTVEGWTKVAAASTKAGRDTGAIAEYLDRTRSSMELFGGILKDTWDIMMALGKAARPLGDRLWGGAARATRGWADFLKSAEGAAQARKWFDSLYEPLHAMGQLAKEASVALFGMTRDTSALTETAAALQGTIPALAKLFQGASEAFGPSVARSLTAISELLAALPWSPLKLVVDALTRMLEIVAFLVKEIPGLGLVISTLTTVALGSKLIAAVGRVGMLASAWNMVTGAATRAGLAQQIAGMAGFGGGRGGGRGMPGGGIPFMGMVPGGKPTGGGGLRGLAGGFKGGGAGAGLAIGLGGGLLASLAGSAIGGDAGNKVSTIGGMAATGAGIGSIIPGVGTLVGALGGAAAGAILGGVTSGLLRSGDTAEAAGRKAGEAYMKGLGRAGIDPATGKPWAPESNPQAQRIVNRQTAIANARRDVVGNSGMTPAQLNQLRRQAPNDPAFKQLNQVEQNSVVAFTSGITSAASKQYLNSAKFVVRDFVTQFKTLGPQAQQSGAEAMLKWARGMEKSGQATKGFTRRVFQGIAGEFDGISARFGGTGRRAFQNFNREMKLDSVRKSMRDTVSDIADNWGDLRDLPNTTLKNWPQQYQTVRSQLMQRIRTSTGQMKRDARADLRQLDAEARRYERTLNRLFNNKPTLKNGYLPGQPYQRFDAKSGTGGPLAPRGRPQGQGPRAANPLFTGLFNTSMIPGVKTPITPKINTGQASRNLGRLGGDAKKAGQSVTNVADRAKIARDRITTHSQGMASAFGQASRGMIDDANSIFSAVNATTIRVSVGGAGTANALGGRLPGFASGGRIPGQAKGDHIPLYGRGGGLLGIADGGELVVNRHTEKRVNNMLAHHGTSLGKEVAGETRPHFAEGGRVPGRTISGGGTEYPVRRQRDTANELLSKQVYALNKKIDMLQPKSGLGEFQGRQVSNWIISVLKYAQTQGWGGSITSGYRSAAKQAAIKANDSRAAAPGASNHNSIDYPGGAVDVGGFEDRAAGSYLNSKIQGFKGKYKLVWGGPTINDWGHFSANGRAYGGRLNFGGWHARGMDGVVSGPTLFGAGERGPERVQVTPVRQKAGGKGGRGGIEVHIGNINYSAKGDIAKAIREEMELLGDELMMMGDANE